jgi:hypothetical protein
LIVSEKPPTTPKVLGMAASGLIEHVIMDS